MDTSALPAPDLATRSFGPPPPYRLYAVHRRPGDRPTPYEMNIFEKCKQADDPDLWEVEVRYIRRVNPMTDDTIERVMDAMVAVAEAAPARPGRYVFAAKIPWTLINELRDALDAADIDWRRP